MGDRGGRGGRVWKEVEFHYGRGRHVFPIFNETAKAEEEGEQGEKFGRGKINMWDKMEAI